MKFRFSGASCFNVTINLQFVVWLHAYWQDASIDTKFIEIGSSVPDILAKNRKTRWPFFSGPPCSHLMSQKQPKYIKMTVETTSFRKCFHFLVSFNGLIVKVKSYDQKCDCWQFREKKIGHPVDLLHDAVIVRQTLEKQSCRQFNC